MTEREFLRNGTEYGLGGAVRYGVRFELYGTGRSAVQVFLRGTVPDPNFPSRVTLYCTIGPNEEM